MYIPYNSGSILIADRQSIESDFTGICKKEVEKLCLKSETGPALGGAGDTELIQTLFGKVRERRDIDNRNAIGELEKLILEVADQCKVMYREYTEFRSLLEDLELIVVNYNNENIIPCHFHGVFHAPLEKTRCYGIGAGFRASGSLLNFDTNDLPERGAIQWGETILRQVAILNYTVGAPEYHGYDVISVSNEGKFTRHSKSPSIPKTIDAVSMLKEFGKIELVEDETQ